MEFEKPIYAYEMGGKKSTPPPVAPPAVEAEEDEVSDADRSGSDTEAASTVGKLAEDALAVTLLDEEEDDSLTVV